ncbi:hypothetical protein BFP70_17600 [Thioclava sp. SK-1]|uniref:hypothetical protein n=1 Tax=Thioclava sp. SK-1 TaxID=1889770 RepID=UPI0008262EAA|nr:hypothetical protein [Thioclava sp. SK-1]OCX60426.1 hypothetical protein BFP70_17600 [Thioclava sp. SK-1]
MSDGPRERHDGGLYFILGAIVVALGVLIWMVMGEPTGTASPDTSSVSITNQVDAPSNDAAPEEPAEVTVAPSADGAKTNEN